MDGSSEGTGSGSLQHQEVRGPVAQFIKFLGHEDIRRVTQQDVRRWRGHLTASGGVSLTTFARVNRAALSAVFSKAMDLEMVAQNHALRIKVDRVMTTSLRDERGFTQDEARTILKAALAAPERRGRTGE